jgi:hypothetical protein
MKQAAQRVGTGEVDEGSRLELTLVPSAQSVFGDDQVALAVRLVDAMGVLDPLHAWKDEESRGPGGDPQHFRPARSWLPW